MFGLMTIAAVGCLVSADITAVRCSTTKGAMTIIVNHEWAPLGVQHFLELVDDGFFSDHALYRAVENFLVQFGMSSSPEQTHRWTRKTIADDPDLGLAFRPGVLSYAGSGPRSRDTSLFLATSTHPQQLKAFGTELWERPLGMVTEGRDVLMSFHTGYGDMAQFGGRGPNQAQLRAHGAGRAYLEPSFPNLDYLLSCRRDEATPAEQAAVDLDSWPKTVAPASKQEALFVNSHSEALDLYWDSQQDQEDRHVLQGTLEPGGTIPQTTFAGHRFVWKIAKQDEVVHTTTIVAGVGRYHAEL